MKKTTAAQTFLALALAIALTGASSAFATDGVPYNCESEAQKAILAIAKINHIDVRAEAANLRVVRTSGRDQGEQVISWQSGDGRFTLTTVARNFCQVEKLSFNPEP